MFTSLFTLVYATIYIYGQCKHVYVHVHVEIDLGEKLCNTKPAPLKVLDRKSEYLPVVHALIASIGGPSDYFRSLSDP